MYEYSQSNHPDKAFMSTASDDYSAIRPQDLPYLNLDNLAGRPIPLHTFHDGNRWHMWMPMENGLLQPLRMHDSIEGIYLSARPVHVHDSYFYFVNFIYKHIDIKQADAFVSALTSDVFNLGASLRKLDLLRADESCRGKSRLVTTELEYLLILCRSMFDLLQEISKRIWETIQLTDKSKTKHNLPSSFRKVVLNNNKVRSPQQIQERFGLSPQLATWYSECAYFFCKLKKLRDAIAHTPIQNPVIYVDEKGFSIGVKSSPLPFREIIQWPEEILEPNGIAPLNYLIACFVNETLKACEEFTFAIQSEIQFPSDFSPDFSFFMRSPNMASLLGLSRVLTTDPWAEFTISESDFINQLRTEAAAQTAPEVKD